jgi:type IX secretion system PorP/SprF family membrane protein
MKKILILALSLFVFGKVFAQDDALLTQFYANKLYYNPAATGFTDKFFVSGAYRSHWAGSPNLDKKARPNYVLLNASQYFWEQRSGVGFTIYDVRQHVQHNFMVKGSYAYHLQVQEEAWLSMGVNLGLMSRSIENSMPAEGGSVDYRNAMMSDLGLGIEFYTPELNVGASVQHIPVIVGESGKRKHTHFYYYMTYYYNVDKDWRVIPSVFLANSSFITNVDITARVSYLNKFQLGAAWRLDAVSLLFGFNFEDTFSLGYSFDIHSGIGRRNGNRPSHEIILSYRTQLLNSASSLQKLKTQNEF